MKILLMDTGNRTTPEKIAMWRTELALEPTDEVALLAWSTARGRLPVVEHLVCGPTFRLGRGPQRPPTSLTPVPADGQATAPIAGSGTPAPAARPTAGLPVYHPRRVRQAIRWRLNKARLKARQQAATGAQGQRKPDLPSRLLSRALRTRSSDVVPEQFALSALTSRRIGVLFRGADVVVPVDARSQMAAWVLAKRHPGPDVVVTFAAAARIIAARRNPAG